MENKAGAFVKGGVGCFVVFVVLGVLALLLGGNVHLDIGGVVLLFIIGGILGLVVNWIYQKGKRDAD